MGLPTPPKQYIISLDHLSALHLPCDNSRIHNNLLSIKVLTLTVAEIIILLHSAFKLYTMLGYFSTIHYIIKWKKQ